MQDVDLPRRVVDVVIAANHVSDRHVAIIDGHAEVIGGCAVGPGDDQIVQFRVGDLDTPLNEVVPGNAACRWILEAHHRFDAIWGRGQLLAGLGSPTSVVAGLFTARTLGGAQIVQFG